MNLFWRRFAFAAIAAAVSACGQTQAAQPKVVAQVGATTITENQVQLRYQSALTAINGAGAPSGNAAMEAQVRDSVIRSLIFDTVIAQEAAYRGVGATASEINAQITQAETDAGGQNQLQTQLAAAGESMDSLRDEITARINEQNLEDYYAKDRVAMVLSTLSGGADFGAAAAQYSDGSNAAKNGSLGALNAQQITSQFSSATLDAVKALAVGDYTHNAIRTNAGYEILKLTAPGADSWTLQEILVAAPNPYTVRERPQWFSEEVFQAILDDCQAHRITVYGSDAASNPCSAPSPSPSASATP